MTEEMLNSQLRMLTMCSQDRFKFIENPDAYVKVLLESYKESKRKTLHKKWFETNRSFQARVKQFDEAFKTYRNGLKKQVEEALKPKYVYYKGNKVLIPDHFYYSFDKPDVPTFLEYLNVEDRKRNIITDEDREKARLLNCNLDYNYLQTLLNKMNINPDIVVSIKTRDGAIITIRKQEKEELEDIILNKDIFIAPDVVR